MLTIGNYIDAALRQAHYEIIDDEEPCYGSVPELQGVWASGKTRARERFGVVRATPFEKGLRRTAVGAWLRSVVKKARVARRPVGSRMSTHRMGNGRLPVEYHKATPVVRSRRVVVAPYQAT